MKENNIEFSLPPMRLDNFLKTIYPSYSREFIKKMIEEGLVSVNSKKVKSSFMLKEKDMVLCVEKNAKESLFSLDEMIIYEDEALLAINKPSGLLVHPKDENWTRNPEALSLGEETLAFLLYGRKNFKMKTEDRFGIVHRLDKDTSGIMLIAKTVSSAAFLKEQFSSRSVEKKYLGVVCGILKKEAFLIDAPIGRKTGDKRVSVYKYGREAQSFVKLIKKGKKFSYLEIMPKTGRTNQIRAHLTFVGHPIAGDSVYGGADCQRLMLHSSFINIKHPKTEKEVSFEAPLDDEFKKITKKLLSL